VNVGEQAGRPEELSLNLEVVEDDELLALVVDEFIRRDRNAAVTLTEIARLHGVLGQIIDDYWWPIWARADELTTARWADLAVGLVRWGFNEGRKHPAVPPGRAT